MVKQLKFIALILAISVFTVAISLFSTTQPVSLVQAADPTPIPPASVVTLTIAIQSNAATQIYVPVRFDPVPLNLTNGLTTAPGNYQFNAGTQVQVLAVQYTPSPGYSVYNFIRWEGPAGNSPVPPGQTITVKMDSDKSITGYYNVDYHFTPTPILTPTPNPQVTVTGYVYDNNTGVGIKGATVCMDTSSTTTDAIGYYCVSHIFTSRPRSVYLTVVAEGYETQTVLVQVAASGDVRKDFYMAPETTPTPTPLPGDIKIQFYNQSITATSNQIYTNFKLVNTGAVSIALSNIKLRYYYTIDGAKPQNFWCDYSPIGNSNVTGTFVTMATPKTGADTYLEVGFNSSAGNLAAGENITVQCRVAKNDWSNYTQTNDYSFNPSATTYVDWTKVTGYVSGVLSWGTEP